jgi:hypothetical protein
MNRMERRVRNMINPYSTAFAGWWCHSGRYTSLARLITGHKPAARPGRRGPAKPGATGDVAVYPSASAMAARRAAMDALLARMAEGEEGPGRGRTWKAGPNSTG